MMTTPPVSGNGNSSTKPKNVTRAMHYNFKINALTPDRIKEWYMQTIRVPVNLSKYHKPHGQVYIIPNRCKSCEFCWSYCPEEVLTKSDHLNNKGYYYPTVAEGKEDACVLCNMCADVCPDFAIFTKDSKIKLEEEVV